ncbi:MAG: biotin carboxylase, partial [Chitinophagaceae bacterium]
YKKPVGEGIRVDDGYEEGMSIPLYYDPMIAKLVTHGKDRMEAIEKMKAAIAAYHIEGVATTLPFGKFVFEHEDFLSGNFDTHFVKDHYTPAALLKKQQGNAHLAAQIALKYWLNEQTLTRVAETVPSAWNKRKQ